MRRRMENDIKDVQNDRALFEILFSILSLSNQVNRLFRKIRNDTPIFFSSLKVDTPLKISNW